VSYKQIENSARPAEVKGNATNTSDLDDRLINQALDIMLNSRKNAVDNSSLSNRANCAGSAIANELNGTADQATNRLANPRSNQAEMGTTTTNTVKELLNNVKEHSHGSASASSRVEQTNSIRNAILNNLLDGTCERGPVIRNGRSDRAVIHGNSSPSTGDVIRAAAEGAIGGVIAGGSAARIGRAAAEGAIGGGVIVGRDAARVGRAAAEGAVAGAVAGAIAGGVAARVGRAAAEGAVAGAVAGGIAARVGRAAAEGAVAGAVAGGIAARVGRAAAEGAARGAVIGAVGTEIGRAAAEGAIGGIVGGPAARIGRGIAEAGKNSESLPPVKNRSSREESDNQEEGGEKSIQNQLPKSIKDFLLEELKRPTEIFACVYRAPVEIRRDDEKGGIIKSPRDIIACAERIPKTGGKPEAGNYFACVHYYPLQTIETRSRGKTY